MNEKSAVEPINTQNDKHMKNETAVYIPPDPQFFFWLLGILFTGFSLLSNSSG